MNIKTTSPFVVRTDTLNSYVRDLSKAQPLTAEEEKDLFTMYNQLSEMSSPAAEELKTEIKNRIITANLRFNYAVAKRYSSNGSILPDLINEGVIGLYEAFDAYDLSRGNRFYTLAVYYIRRAIKAFLDGANLTVRPKNYARLAPKIRKIEKDFTMEHGRAPAASEIVDILRDEYGIVVKDEYDVTGVRVDNLEEYIGSDDDYTVVDSAAFNEKTCSTNGYMDEMEKDYVSHEVKEMLSMLSERERLVISMAYGYGYDKEFKDAEIADELGMTSERIRQIRHAAMKKLRCLAVSKKN